MQCKYNNIPIQAKFKKIQVLPKDIKNDIFLCEKSLNLKNIKIVALSFSTYFFSIQIYSTRFSKFKYTLSDCIQCFGKTTPCI